MRLVEGCGEEAGAEPLVIATHVSDYLVRERLADRRADEHQALDALWVLKSEPQCRIRSLRGADHRSALDAVMVEDGERVGRVVLDSVAARRAIALAVAAWVQR